MITINHEVPEGCKGGVIAIGNFDGVHRGHQVLLAEAAAIAVRADVPWGVLTFEPHPRSVFRPEEPFFRLTPQRLKTRLIAGLGGDFVTPLKFDLALAALEAEDFVEHYLVEGLQAFHVVTGYDFHFGRGRKGNPTTMQALGHAHDFGVTVVEQVTDDDGIAPYSSSSVRSMLRHGRTSEAAEQLGYWWTVLGKVVRGDQRGREIGYPTVNIVMAAGCEPKQGIYAVRVRDLTAGASQSIPGAGYVGYRPTFASDRAFLEVHLLDFDGDLYDHELMVEFVDYIRPDQKFESVEDLTRQMNNDCLEISERLAQVSANDPMRQFPLGELQATCSL